LQDRAAFTVIYPPSARILGLISTKTFQLQRCLPFLRIDFPGETLATCSIHPASM